MERLFRVNLSNDPYCMYCLIENEAVEADLEHFFCGCQVVAHVWSSLKEILLNLLPWNLKNILDFDLLTLRFPKIMKENEICWLLTTYVSEVWINYSKKGSSKLCEQQVFGFLKYKYRTSSLFLRIPELM